MVPKGTFGKSIQKNTNCSIGVVDTMATVAVVCFAVDNFRVSCVVQIFFVFRIQNFFFDQIFLTLSRLSLLR